jgi:hypothetical protein
MEAKNKISGLYTRQKVNDVVNSFSGYPAYPVSEDIYSRYKEENNINPEDISKTKESDYSEDRNNEIDFIDDVSGRDLDVPGAELDDNQENIGSEDEENNYYSLGGDDHNDLEEDHGN